MVDSGVKGPCQENHRKLKLPIDDWYTLCVLLVYRKGAIVTCPSSHTSGGMNARTNRHERKSPGTAPSLTFMISTVYSMVLKGLRTIGVMTEIDRLAAKVHSKHDQRLRLDRLRKWTNPCAAALFQHKNDSQRVLIAISGTQGSGKTTLAEKVVQRIKVTATTADNKDCRLAMHVPMDGYHLYRSQLAAMAGSSNDHPLTRPASTS